MKYEEFIAHYGDTPSMKMAWELALKIKSTEMTIQEIYDELILIIRRSRSEIVSEILNPSTGEIKY